MSRKDIKQALRKIDKTPPFRVTSGGVDGAGHPISLISNKDRPEDGPVDITTSSSPRDRNAGHRVAREARTKIWDKWGISISCFMNFIPSEPIHSSPQERWDNLMRILTQEMGFEESLIIYAGKEPPPLGVPFIFIAPMDTLHSKRQQILLGISSNYAMLAGAYAYPKRVQHCGLAVFLVSEQGAHLKDFKDNLSLLGHLRY